MKRGVQTVVWTGSLKTNNTIKRLNYQIYVSSSAQSRASPEFIEGSKSVSRTISAVHDSTIQQLNDSTIKQSLTIAPYNTTPY